MLTAHRVPVVAPKGQINDCTGCTELCCVGPRSTVLLRLSDIATLIDINKTELIDLQKPTFTAEELENKPALRLQVASNDWATFPVLAQDKMGVCKALSSDGACTLFPFWPLTCERFPYSLNVDASEITYSRRCRSFWIRPDAQSVVRRMSVAAVTSYNERLKDRILLEYAPQRLAALGLTRFLSGPQYVDPAGRAGPGKLRA